MKANRIDYTSAAVVLAMVLFAMPVPSHSQQSAGAAIAIGSNDVAGVVKSANGPEAGVWVVAETKDLPTKFARVVVTDEQGRYLIPDLPRANYSIWVRGYGLIDSPKIESAPGRIVDLTAQIAPNEAAAAQYYPAIYWYSMLEIPQAREFPGTGEQGNGIPVALRTQAYWVAVLKTDGCMGCHQIGNKATRTIEQELGSFDTAASAWTRRIQSGQASPLMVRDITRLGPQRGLRLFGNWTDRIAAGELPFAKPSRPQGVERNLVVTVWDWSGPHWYLHDEISSDRRDPTVNANGPIFGSPEASTDFVPVLDPVKNAASQIKVPVRDPKTPSALDDPMFAASPYWGEERIWDSQTNTHNPMFDSKGRVWFTSRIHGPVNSAFCQKGSDHPSAKLFPVQRAGRQLAMYDPKTKKFTTVDTCFSTHHLQFDAQDRLWASSGAGGNGVADIVGWLDTRKFDATGDEQKSQGWTALILDTNGNGKRDENYVEPNQPVDPTKDKRIVAGFYGVAPSLADGMIWGSVLGMPGSVVRLNPGDNPPATALAEIYEPPFPGYSPHVLDVDSNGVVWVPLASGHLGTFDRRKCKGPLNGPTATGKHCPEGWTLHPFPGPQFRDVTDSGSAESSYDVWIDRANVLGLGKDVPIATGNDSDALHAFVDGKFIELRLPYPIGFFAKGLDGRIDDANAGWKGRGLWSTFGNRTPYHLEGGKGTLPKVVKFQLRPDPLAR
ncbi:MAG TPA: carboxypeptidase-like regulatory domain-containing protein [Xanthobacteraceae bacterium]|jgi:hypothetical protein